eukprot:534948-Pleurochrysis_carterae.AAC.1
MPRSDARSSVAADGKLERAKRTQPEAPHTQLTFLKPRPSMCAENKIAIKTGVSNVEAFGGDSKRVNGRVRDARVSEQG